MSRLLLRAVRLLVPTLTAVLVLAVSPSAGRASPSIQYGLQDDAWLPAGPGPNTLPARIALLKELGVGIVRYNLPWNAIAAQQPAVATDPDDPAYEWGFSGPVLDALHDAGIAVLLTINGTPSWANGARAPAYAPTSATAMSDFATAAAGRYRWSRSGRSGTSPTSCGGYGRARPAST